MDRDGKPVGEIVAVQNYGAGDLLEIRLSGGTGQTQLVPFTDAHVPEVKSRRDGWWWRSRTPTQRTRNSNAPVIPVAARMCGEFSGG